MAERNFEDTGAGIGSSAKYIKVKTKEAKFEFPDESKDPTFAGYLERVDMEFKDPSPEHDLPARWEIRLIETAKLPDDPDTGAQYNVSLSSHWANPIVANVINGIRGALEDPRWADPTMRYIRIWLSLKEPGGGKRPYCSALGFISKNKGDYLPNFYPWNEAGGFYDGVPRDMVEANTFWLGVAHAVVKLTGGTVINADKASIPLPAPIGTTITNTPPPVSAEKSVVDRAKDYINNSIAGGKAFIDAVTIAFNAAQVNGATKNDLRMLAGWCTTLGIQSGAIPFGFIKIDGTWEQVQAPAAGVNTNITANPTPPGFEDLPF